MLLALGLIILTWHYALRCGFISDDHATVAGRKDIIPDTEKTPIPKGKWEGFFDKGPVMCPIDWVFEKLRIKKIPFAWHLFCLGLHLLNFYLLVKVLTPIMNYQLALITAFMWAVNPMVNQTAVWISGRPYGFGMMFTLLCFIFWDKPYIVLPFYGLSVITNLSGALLPIIIKIVYPSWQSNLYLGVLIFIGIPIILWKFNKRFYKALVIDRDYFRWKNRRVFSIARLYLYYAYCLFVPVNMGWYHQVGFRYNDRWEKFNIRTLLGFCLVALLISKGVFGWWFLLFLIPNMNIFVVNAFAQDRYVYLASVGIWALLAPMFYNHPVLCIIAATFYCTRSYMYSRNMRDDEKMYRENWRNHPKSDYAANNLSFFLIQQQRFEEARVVILRAMEIVKDNKMLWYNLGITRAAQGNFTSEEGRMNFLRALDAWKMCLQIEPRWRKPAEDIEKMLKLLEDNKVISTKKTAENSQEIDVPKVNLNGYEEKTNIS